MADASQAPDEGTLLERAREARGLSQNKAASRAGLSGTRWRQIVYGVQPVAGGDPIPVRGNAETVARMARAVGVTSAELRDVGRRDAAEELDLILASKNPVVASNPAEQIREILAGSEYDDGTKKAVLAIIDAKEAELLALRQANDEAEKESRRTA